MTSDAERWDEKYRAGRWNQEAVCDPFVARALDTLGPGNGRRALDLASGPGRHALDLAERGWLVEAWDVSCEGLELLAERARQAGLAITRHLVDLTAGFPVDAPRFELIILVNYLDREVLGRLPGLLAPNGRLVFVTYTKDRPGTHPSMERCLDPGELAMGMGGMLTESHEERGGRAGIVARMG